MRHIKKIIISLALFLIFITISTENVNSKKFCTAIRQHLYIYCYSCCSNSTNNFIFHIWRNKICNTKNVLNTDVRKNLYEYIEEYPGSHLREIARELDLKPSNAAWHTALITCVNARLNGRDMTIGDGFSNAGRHIGSILAWAVISATVGLILQIIHDRAGFLGQIATALVGGVWSLVTFFVVPILILEDKVVFDAVKESVSLIKRTWGESIVGSVSIMLIFVATGMVRLVLVMAALFAGNMIIFGIALVLFILLVIVLAIIASAMQGIFVTALYTYARTGIVPSAFDKALIQNAFVPKQVGSGNI